MKPTDNEKRQPSAAKAKSAAPPNRKPVSNPRTDADSAAASTDGNRQRGVIVAPTPG